MTLWVADLLDQLKIDRDFKEDIASSLFEIALELKHDGDFHSARSYFELAAKKYQQCSEEQGWLDAHIAIADCFELEGDSRSAGSNMVANSFYENAIQAYRRIPNKNRVNYDVESRISAIRHKINDSGRASLDEMALIETPGVDVSEIAKSSMAHVAGKSSPEEALMYLSGLFAGPKYQELASSAKEIMQESIFSSLAGSSHMSSDGRVIAKTPPMNLGAGEDDPANQAALHRQIQQQFSIEIQLVVEGQILPALRQLLMEHRFTKELMVAACHHSPIVPKNREELLGYALWLGFEHEFGTAIHLLCPQTENIVRSQLKEAGAHTSNIDREGIENENGLSTLMEMQEAIDLFGEDLTFEIKSVFTDALGFNLRNEVAHGLVDDNTSSSIQTVYAWWMILRLVIRSLAATRSKQ
jgi:tetratricopeptide (TPR) repeat protein